MMGKSPMAIMARRGAARQATARFGGAWHAKATRAVGVNRLIPFRLF